MDEDTMELLGALFDDELAGYDDDGGDDPDILDMGEDGQMLGAFRLPRKFRRGRVRRGRGRNQVVRAALQRVQAKKANYLNALNPAVPGVPAPGARKFALGFGVATFVNGGATAIQLTANPQRPFKGARLVIDVRRSALATGELVSITKLDIGQNNQIVSAASLPAEAFAPNSFDTMLSLDPATPGIDVVLGLQISAAPAIGESVTVSATIIGETIG